MNTLNAFAAITLAALCGVAFAHGDKPRAAQEIGHPKAGDMSFGRAADAKKAGRTIRIHMSDEMRFTPSQLTVRQGEVVRFEVANKGRVMHEMVLGAMDDLKKHAELMRKHAGMEHDGPHMAHVSPGRTGEIGWQFTRAGEFYYGCLIPGHFEAGMVGKVNVIP
ncbi:MAG: hypothetical protein A3G81_25135 [Betaproteobacteria bacterium RIFCSPLOWO2_12_FULL_65_14]|nr:MAG: hypothetical protein A3G81_25135 [Betaproteobacteria bacterium RIFCSPLOWO2_12_FULL_65_14]